ncbi:T9SS type A sorting domain-containing protein [Persicobacter psychrovividus]|uniref:PorZ N-terminal beta-propeller domain-containing protein n=1 Tax=Persicobacter psychrovividus TaxID=387638 RepID=A0ABN6LEL4_9BACT|nr:hypothetical protein PEPS_21470 [Persicobacter psychrovividus]
MKNKNNTTYKLILSNWCLFLFFSLQASAQEIPTGSWRSHFNYRQAALVASNPDSVCCATQNSLFFYDRQSNEVEVVSSSDGLSENEFSTLAYDARNKAWLIGYQSGGIDQLKGRAITTFDAIRQDPQPGDKAIQKILFKGDTSIVILSYGAFIYESSTNRVISTARNLGQNGAALRILDGTVKGDSLMLATAEGIIGNDLTGKSNIQDYSSWQRYNTLWGHPSANVQQITTFDGQLFWAEGSQLFSYQEGVQQVGQTDQPVQHFNTADELMVVDGLHLYQLQDSGLEAVDLQAQQPQQISGNADQLWIADARVGLVSKRGAEERSIAPSGISSVVPFHIDHQGERVMAFRGGYQLGVPNGDPGAFDVFLNGRWTNFDAENTQPEARDVVDAFYRQQSETYAVATMGTGLWEVNAQGEFSRSPSSVIPQDAPLSTIIGDRYGNEWLSQYDAQPALWVKAGAEEWKPLINQSLPIVQLLVHPYQNILVARMDPSRSRGIYVYDFENQVGRLLNSASINNLPSDNINDMAFDRLGNLWLATDQGVGYLPSGDWLNQSVAAVLPIYEGFPIFNKKEVSSITIDGGNRKWFGNNTGLFLYSKPISDFTNNSDIDLLGEFTTENSLLPSNEVLRLTDEPRSGEVFVQTRAGLVSFRADASAGVSPQGEVKIFPNPVRGNFSGPITISQLSTDATVKITDLSGRLLYETTANGGTATWNGSLSNGARAGVGIYLVWVAQPDGTDATVGKVAIVN